MRRTLLTALVALVAACSGDPPAATVNGKPISTRAFEAQVTAELDRQRRQRSTLKPGMEQRVRETVLRRMVEEEIVAQKALALGLPDAAAREKESFEAMKASRFPTSEAWNEYLERTGHTEASLREEHRRNARRERVLDAIARQSPAGLDRAAALQALMAEARVGRGP
jgi:hypothetical protein